VRRGEDSGGRRANCDDDLRRTEEEEDFDVGVRMDDDHDEGDDADASDAGDGSEAGGEAAVRPWTVHHTPSNKQNMVGHDKVRPLHHRYTTVPSPCGRSGLELTPTTTIIIINNTTLPHRPLIPLSPRAPAPHPPRGCPRCASWRSTASGRAPTSSAPAPSTSAGSSSEGTPWPSMTPHTPRNPSRADKAAVRNGGQVRTISGLA
jgi:hypothetical protein